MERAGHGVTMTDGVESNMGNSKKKNISKIKLELKRNELPMFEVQIPL